MGCSLLSSYYTISGLDISLDLVAKYRENSSCSVNLSSSQPLVLRSIDTSMQLFSKLASRDLDSLPCFLNAKCSSTTSHRQNSHHPCPSSNRLTCRPQA